MTTGRDQETHQYESRPTTVVGIGASAGGLMALREFFARVPDHTGIAWVVVVHLNPEHESHLADVLQPHVRMPVQQVAGDVQLEPDHVYVIPPGANLSSVDTHLRLSGLERRREERAPIDHFFRTLASTHHGHSVGVVLTGTGSDGALGLRSIKENNGLTLVQEPDEAEYDGMPRSAIATGQVDQVLPLAEIPDVVVRFAHTRPRLRVPGDGEDVAGEERRLLQKIFAQVHARTGRDFSRYKRSTLMRRIQRRMQLLQIEESERYLERLREDAGEVRALADDILITVTNFFRDGAIWEEIEREVIPRLFEGKTERDQIRVWSVGCATGEEAYSLAILLYEAAGRRENPPHLQVFASDLHERSLESAREGFYPGDIEADVSSERLRRFFEKENGGYRVRKEIRELIVFAPHNLLANPPFSRLDLVSCRNLMIYLQREAQQEALEIIHYALLSGGFLVLGSAETVEGSDLFRVENKPAHVFRKRNVSGPEPRLPPFPSPQIRPGARLRMPEPPGDSVVFGAMHHKLVEAFAPPSMLVGPDGRVVHLSEHAGRYLVIPGGEPTTSAHQLVRDELRIELRTALHAAREKRAATRSRPISVRFDGESADVILDVRPSPAANHDGYALVIFDERADAATASAAGPPSAGAAETPDAELESELEETKHRLQAVIEEYETSQEEMRASHEELQSSNEELRSTLEELETSREELQSMNEELQTVNQENRHKVEELSQLSSDLQNLMSSTEIATLFLDRDLRIMRFTAQVGKLFNARSVDRGRPLSDLTHRLGYPEIQADSETVLRHLAPVEREVRDEQGRWYLTRVLPYRSSQDRIEGVVITFVDITDRKRAEEELRELNETLERRVEERTRVVREQEQRFWTLVEAARLIVWTTDAKGIVVEEAPSWEAFTGARLEGSIEASWSEVVHPADREMVLARWRQAVDEAAPLDLEFRIRHAVSESWRWTNLRAVPLRDDDGNLRGWIGMNIDVDERRRAEEGRNEALRQLVTAEEEERRRISRELHDQLGQQLTGLLLGLRGVVQDASAADLAERIGELERLTAGISRDVQTLALELRPPALDTLGLVAALQSHLEEWGERHGIEYDFHTRGFRGLRLTREVETTLYRVVQEALTNVLKHASARRVNLLLERRDGVVGAILEDDGIGFEVEVVLAAPDKQRRLGIRGMRERVGLLGGDLQIESSPGSGTTLYVRVPAAEMTV